MMYYKSVLCVLEADLELLLLLLLALELVLVSVVELVSVAVVLVLVAIKMFRMCSPGTIAIPSVLRLRSRLLV